MAVDEVPNHPVQVRLRRKLEELVGVEEADLLMDRPPGGWSSLVTKDWLDERLTHERELTDERFRGIDERFRSLEGRFDERFRSLEGRFDERFRSFEDRMDARFGGIDERFRSLEDRFDERFRGIDRQFEVVYARLDSQRYELLGAMHEEFRNQTWRLITALFGAIAMLAAVVATVTQL